MPNRSERRHPPKAPTVDHRVRKANKIVPAEFRKDGPHGDVFLAYMTTDSVTTSFMRSWHDLIAYDVSGSRRLNTWGSGRAGALQLASTRNALAAQMLDSQADWLFMVDADMGFEPNSLDRLLAVADPIERPVVGGLCFMQRELQDDGMNGLITYPAPTIYKWQKHPTEDRECFIGTMHYPVNTMIRVGATGGAFLIIHRNALEKIAERDGSEWFTQKVGTDGKLEGEDISFFDRCRELDIPAWVHTGVRTTHYKHLWLSEQDYEIARHANPGNERVDVIVPTLGKRPENIPKLLESLISSTGLAKAWYVVQRGDADTATAVKRFGGEVIFGDGTFAEKVNHAYRVIGELEGENAAPWLLLVGDDVTFRAGWLDKALETAKLWKADVVGTNDMLNPRVLRGEHATHPLIRRAYVEEVGASFDGPGIVCHEGYRHCFVDDEIVRAARSRHVFQACLGACVPHHHPMGGDTPMDEVYQQGQSHFERDQKYFEQRMKDIARQAVKIELPVEDAQTVPR